MNEMFNEMVLKMILFTEEDSLSVRVVQFSVGVSLTYVEQENIQKRANDAPFFNQNENFYT